MGSNSSTLVVNNVLLNGPATGQEPDLWGLFHDRYRHLGGGDATNGVSQPAMQVGAITPGNGDLIFDSAAGADGLARLTLTQTCSYTGDTFMVQYSTRGPAGNGTAGECPSSTWASTTPFPSART